MSRSDLSIPRSPISATPPARAAMAPAAQPMSEDAPAVTTTAARATEASETGTLVLGHGISLQGSIVGASRIVIEGTFDSKRLETSELVIGRSGLFRGEAEVNDAEVDGRFEGVIKASGRLGVLSNGSLAGSAQYGSLAVQPGGAISGDLSALRD